MKITPIKTRLFLPPKDSLDETLKSLSKRLKNGDIVVITSKIVSIAEGRCIPLSKFPNNYFTKIISNLPYGIHSGSREKNKELYKFLADKAIN